MNLAIVLVGAIGAVLLFASISEVISTYGDPVEDLPFGRDLRGFTVAGDMAADRDGPAMYDHEDERFSTVDAANYFYPPWFALVMVPLAAVPFKLLYLLWSAAAICLLFVAARRVRIDHWAAVAAALIITYASISGVWFGQTGHLLLALVAAGAIAAVGDQPVRAGVWFAFAAFKPHLLLALVIQWLIDLRRWWKLLAAMAGTSLVLLIVSELWLPGSWVAFVRRLLTSEPLAAPEREVSVLSGIQLLIGEELAVYAAVAAYMLIIGSFVVVQRRRQQDVLLTTGLAVVVSLLLPPHSLPYDWLLLLVAFGLVLLDGRIPTASIASAALLLALSLAVGFRISDWLLDVVGYSVHLPPFTLVGVAIWLGLSIWRLPQGQVADQPS